MFCAACGTAIEAGASNCTNCGAPVVPASDDSSDGGALYGFWVLLSSFFTMPFKTLRRAGHLLRQLGRRGALDVATDIPHLTWLQTAQAVTASAVMIVILLFGLYSAFKALDTGGYFGNPYATALTSLIGAYLTAVLADWVIMVVAELLSLSVNIANDLKHIAGRGEGTATPRPPQ